MSSPSLARRVCGKIELEGTLFVGVFGVCTPATISLSFTPESVCSIPTRKVSVKSPGLFSKVPYSFLGDDHQQATEGIRNCLEYFLQKKEKEKIV